MEKVFRCFAIILIVLLITIFSYNIYVGTLYKRPEFIGKENAIKIAQEYISEACSKEYIETILNYHSPDAEMKYIDYQVVHLSGKGKNTINADMCWCIIFTTPLDKFVGAHEVYIDGVSGEVLGSPFRM